MESGAPEFFQLQYDKMSDAETCSLQGKFYATTEFGGGAIRYLHL